MMDEDIAKIEWWKDTSKKTTGFQLFQRAGNPMSARSGFDPPPPAVSVQGAMTSE